MKKTKWWPIIVLVIGIIAIMVISMKLYLAEKERYDNVNTAVLNVVNADSEEDYQETMRKYKSSLEHLDDPAIEMRILFKEWSEVQRRILEVLRALDLEAYEFSYIEEKLERTRLLMEGMESKIRENILAKDELSSEYRWEAYNLLGCIELYKILFIKDDSNDEERANLVKGFLNEAAKNFKEAINVIEHNELTGIETDIPRRNLELLYDNKDKNKQSKRRGDSQDQKDSEDEEENEGEVEKDKIQELVPHLEKEEEEAKRDKLQKLIPHLNLPDNNSGGNNSDGSEK